MKERLTGAIILVVVVVLLVPELLSGPSRSAPPAAPALPTSASAEEAPLRSYTINLQDDAHAAGAGTVSTPVQSSGPAQPTPITEAPTPDPAQPQAATGSGSAETDDSPPTQTQAAATAVTPPPAENPPPAAPRAVTPPPSPQGISSLTARSQHSTAPSAPQRSAASERPAPALQHYAAADGRPAERHPAERPTTERSESSGALGGWMVQLGVFSVQANAERLAQELKTQGFHTLVSQMGSAGRPLWRVRAGPVAEHAAAEQLGARLRAAGHPGSVVPK